MAPPKKLGVFLPSSAGLSAGFEGAAAGELVAPPKKLGIFLPSSAGLSAGFEGAAAADGAPKNEGCAGFCSALGLLLAPPLKKLGTAGFSVGFSAGLSSCFAAKSDGCITSHQRRIAIRGGRRLTAGLGASTVAGGSFSDWKTKLLSLSRRAAAATRLGDDVELSDTSPPSSPYCGGGVPRAHGDGENEFVARRAPMYRDETAGEPAPMLLASERFDEERCMRPAPRARYAW